jgi:quinol monooxygenase YgiN
MPTGQPCTFGYYVIKKGKEDAFKSAWENLARESMKHYRVTGPVRLLQNPDNPQEYISYEEWIHLNDVKDWMEQPYYKQFVKNAEELCDTVMMHLYTVTTDVPIRAPDFEKIKSRSK